MNAMQTEQAEQKKAEQMGLLILLTWALSQVVAICFYSILVGSCISLACIVGAFAFIGVTSLIDSIRNN